MIFGLPLGRVIGLTVGWRMTFLCVAAVAFLVLFYLLFVFPKMSNGTPFQIRQLPQILKRRQLLGIYLITFLVASAYYTGYSYIEPFLKQVAHLADSWITIVLTLFCWAVSCSLGCMISIGMHSFDSSLPVLQ